MDARASHINQMRPASIAPPQGMLVRSIALHLSFCHQGNNHLLEQHTWIDTMRLGQASEGFQASRAVVSTGGAVRL